MYTFKPKTDRIERMRAAVRDRVMIADADMSYIKFDAQQKYKNYPPMLQKPSESLYVIQNMPINMHPEEYFVGDMGSKSWGAASGAMWTMMDIEHTWPMGEDGLYHAPDDDPLYSHQKLAISPEELARFRELNKKRMSMSSGIFPEEWLPNGAREFFALQASDYGKIGGFPVMLPPGHLTPGFQTILKRGYADIRKQAQDWLDAHEGNVQGNDMGKFIFYTAATIACDGAITLTKR